MPPFCRLLTLGDFETGVCRALLKNGSDGVRTGFPFSLWRRGGSSHHGHRGGGELGSDVGDQDSVGSDDSTEDEDAVRPDADVVDDSSGKPDGHTPKQGEFDWPCNGNDECHSGLCVEGAEGPVCTKLCQLGECPDGWYCRGMSVGPDVVSVCIPEGANLCKPLRSTPSVGMGFVLN